LKHFQINHFAKKKTINIIDSKKKNFWTKIKKLMNFNHSVYKNKIHDSSNFCLYYFHVINNKKSLSLWLFTDQYVFMKIIINSSADIYFKLFHVFKNLICIFCHILIIKDFHFLKYNIFDIWNEINNYDFISTKFKIILFK